MHYIKYGSSKKFIVFLHGWGADKNSFLWLKEQFCDEYSLVFVDFAGFGESPEPSTAFSVFDYVNELKVILDKFEIEDLIFVAHSFGGRVAIKFLFFYQYLFNVVALCLVDAAGVLPRRTLNYHFKVFKYKFVKKLSKKFPIFSKRLNGFGSSDYKCLTPVMKQTFIKVVNEDLTCYLKFLSCKTLIVWGSKDRDTKPYMAKILNKSIKNSKLVIFRGAGHFSFLEKKEDFVIVLDTFLKNL